ncbi:hypothetical protein NHG23_08925 [Aerococcaceae bacterium NML190073]|nr:hypothetical protein [Aerococcaceae bacterium NML190073]MCW6664334.1 hypothetical protein [Aerococcaceae bacterium NML191219]MCW6679804.1 hypothetical protein [Aerococcaceae bacterium NML130460]
MSAQVNGTIQIAYAHQYDERESTQASVAHPSVDINRCIQRNDNDYRRVLVVNRP